MLNQSIQNPKVEAVYNLIRDAYDISSGGMGIERHLLNALAEGRTLKSFGEEIYRVDHNSNFIQGSIYIAFIVPKKIRPPEYENFFGERSESIRQKYNSLRKQARDLCNIVLRSMLKDTLVEDMSDLSEDEINDFLSYVARDTGRTTQKIQKLKNYLGKEKSIADVLGCFYIETVIPSKEFHQKLYEYKKDKRLRTRHIQLHADKLELMVELLEGGLEAAKSESYEIPDDYMPATLDSRWAENWRKMFGEEFPTVYELLQKSKESIQIARQLLTNNKT